VKRQKYLKDELKKLGYEVELKHFSPEEQDTAQHAELQKAG
jgi:hypothetical protein